MLLLSHFEKFKDYLCFCCTKIPNFSSLVSTCFYDARVLHQEMELYFNLLVVHCNFISHNCDFISINCKCIYCNVVFSKHASIFFLSLYRKRKRRKKHAFSIKKMNENVIYSWLQVVPVEETA